jgi:hypothetical protein
MIKTLGSLQDLRPRDMRQAEDERGWSECGVASWPMARNESTSHWRSPIKFVVKRAGEPDAGNPPVRFDVAGAGNGLRLG